LLGSIGVLRGKGQDVEIAREQTTLYSAVGARLGAEIPLFRALWLRAHLDAMAPLKPVSLTIDGKVLWTTPGFWGGLGLAAGMSF
jgi:hypothetical protein